MDDATWPDPECAIYQSSEYASGTESRLRQPLDDKQLRLVRIHPGPPDTAIICETGTFPLDEDVEYVAISYAWGSKQGKHEINVDGEVQLLSKNLWHFLRHARQIPEYFQGWLWVDALSIDQDNLQERANQVKIMATIFWGAQRVIVWLGTASNGSDIAMKSLEECKLRSPQEARFPSILDSQIGYALQDLCERSYWQRLWVLQELKHGRRKRLMCGETVIKWSSFENLILNDHIAIWTERLTRRMAAVRSSAAASLAKLIRAKERKSLWSLIEATQHLRCSELRDKVFAILSIADMGHEEIEVDYTLPLPKLLNAILRNEHEISTPETTYRVHAQYKLLEDIFGLKLGSMFAPIDISERSNQPAWMHSLPYKLGPLDSHISLCWAASYGHSKVLRLLFRNWKYDYFRCDLSGAMITPQDIAATLLLLRESALSTKTGSIVAEMFDQAQIRGYIQQAIKAEDLAVLKLLLKLPRPDPTFGVVEHFEWAVIRSNHAILQLLLDSLEFHAISTYNARAILYHAAAICEDTGMQLLLVSGRFDSVRHDILSHKLSTDKIQSLPKAMRSILFQWSNTKLANPPMQAS